MKFLTALPLITLLAGCCFVSMEVRPVKEILIVGDGITCNAPQPELGWNNTWGMAATAKERDFAHQLEANARKSSPDVKLTLDNIMYEDTMTGWIHLVPNPADVVVIQLGDNWQGGVPAEEYGSAYAQMIDELREGADGKIVVCVGPWSNPELEPFIAKAAADKGALFVSLKEIAADPANRAAADGKFPKLAARPGDRGMKAIADAVWQAIEKELAR